MSQETLDLRRSIRIVRRHKLLMGVALILGVLAGGAYAVLKPSMVTSTAQVLLSPTGQAASAAAAAAGTGGVDPYTETQEVIAKSSPVLVGALPHVRPAMSVTELKNEVTIGSQTAFIISISVQARDAADAAATANAVAKSYIAYIGSPSSPGGAVQSQLLEPATGGTGSGLLKHLINYIIYGLVGGIFGTVIGAVIALAVNRSDPRLRARDEIANSIGVPVLASFPVGHPSNPGDWTRLLEDYKPGAMHALQLRKALQQLEMAAEVGFGRESGSWSFTVLSLTTDPGALALGPQLAIFAAAQGIQTALIVAQQDAAVTASLRTACAAPPNSAKWPKNLQVLVSDPDVERAVEEGLPRDAGGQPGQLVGGGREVIVNPEPILLAVVPVQRENNWVGHLLISVAMPVMRVGARRPARRPSCGRRPVVASAESGFATRMPVSSRPPETALTASRASWSAVAAPAETPSSVAVVWARSGTCGFRPSTTPTTTDSVTPGWPPASRGKPSSTARSTSGSDTSTCRFFGHLAELGGAAQAVRSEAVTAASCCATIRAVWMP